MVKLLTKINGEVVEINDNPIIKISIHGHTITYVRKDGTKGIYKG